MGRAVRAMDGLLILEQRGKIPHSIIDGYMNFFDQVSGCFDEGGDATPAVLSGFRSTLRNLDVETRKVLTHASSVLNLIPVKPKERTLKELLRDLNRLTEQPGKKSELAEFLKAPLESVSRWLSGSREPGGQTVLKMDYWVNLQERKQ
jgi:hypothetical protein